MAASGSSTTVPEGFHYETKYVLLSYLGLPPPSPPRPTEAAGYAAQDTDVDETSRIKQQIEEEMKLLEEDISASFPRTGFDRHTSPVFSPANPESSIEDSLAVLGDRVAQDLDTHLTSATHTLLNSELDYEHFWAAVQEVASHSQGGWSKVLVPLVLLQTLQAKGKPLASLLALGVRYLEEVEADFIIQQGGWSAAFGLEDVDEPGLVIAEDSNDIYILSGEQLSPPESLLTTADAESLPVSLSGHESWAQVGAMEPEDAKSLDSAEGAALAEERSENNSSNSDIVHVEREEAELLEEAGEEEEGELQESVLSVLGSDTELAALRAEVAEEDPLAPAPEDTAAVVEEPLVITATPASLVAVEPEPPAVAVAAAAAPLVPDVKPEPKAAQPEPVPAPVEPQLPSPVKEPPISTPILEVEPLVATTLQEPQASAPTSAPVPAPASAQEPGATVVPPAQTERQTSDLPVLLYGGAALVAIAAIAAYGALAYRKK